MDIRNGFGGGEAGVSGSLPIRVTNSGRGFSAPFFVFVLLPAIFAMVVPFLTLGLLALGETGAREAIAARAGSLLMISLGLGVWVAMLGVPAWHYLKRLGWKQNVAITEDRKVFVVEAGLFRTRHWSRELDSFRGVKHRVRTDLSTAVHELVLVHAEPARSVVIVSGATISAHETRLLAQMLGLGLIAGTGNEAVSTGVADDIASRPSAIASGSADALSGGSRSPAVIAA